MTDRASITLAHWRGDVRRWHANPCKALRDSGDTIHSHQARCVMLLLRLHPDPASDLIKATLHHDTAEQITGDVPYGAKRMFPAICRELDKAESQIAIAMEIPQPWGSHDTYWIKLVDRLDAYLWAFDVAQSETLRDDWLAALDDIYDMADGLGVLKKVRDIIKEARNCAGLE